MKIFKMIRGFFLKRSRSYKIMQNVIFHVKLLSPTLNHFTKTRPLTESHLEDLLKTMKGFKFIETLEITFEKDTIDSKTGKHVSIYKTEFFNGKAKTITKVDDIEPELNMSRQEILNVIDK